jgi:hypothetical protein
MARFNKRLIIGLSLAAFILFMTLSPTVQGYGTSFTTAESISNGTTQETLSSSDDYAYFKIGCSSGDGLNIVLKWYNGFDLDLALLNPSMTSVASSGNVNSDDSVTYTVTSGGTYYIRVHRYSGTGATTIQLIVSGSSGAPATPGFDMPTMLVVIFSVCALGIVLLKKRSKLVVASE